MMKKIFTLGVLLSSLGLGSAFAQSVSTSYPPAPQAAVQEPQSANSLPPGSATGVQTLAGSAIGSTPVANANTNTMNQGPYPETTISPVQGNR